MDPILINATLLQQPQPWWSSNLISSIVAFTATIVAVYLGIRWTTSSERERAFLKARKDAYFRYTATFFNTGQIIALGEKHGIDLISRELPKLWEAALGAQEYGDISDISFTLTLNNILKPGFPFWEFNLKKFFGDHRGSKCKLTTGNIPTIEIESFYGFVDLLDALMQIDPDVIEMNSLVECGNKYIPIFRNIVLNERTARWVLWGRRLGFKL